jgi:hypothetical protein
MQWEPDIETQKWLEARKSAGSSIDLANVEVDWKFGNPGDPYGVRPDWPDENRMVGRVYFARSPGSDIWVWFGDLPNEVSDKLWAMIKSGKIKSQPDDLPF